MTMEHTITSNLALFHAHRQPRRKVVKRFFDKRIRQVRCELVRLKVKRALFAPSESRLP